MHFLNLESADITGTIRVSFFEDSDQFKQEVLKAGDGGTFDDIKRWALDTIATHRLYRRGNYWATFCQLQSDGKYVEIVNQRMK